MKIYVTGAAGFIGMHTVKALAERGHEVAGCDNFNSYYDVALKRARALEIAKFMEVEELDISNHNELLTSVLKFSPDVIIHLAAQAGVRYSIESPFAYAQSNLVGHVSVLEACRALGPSLSHLVYASSSSVYGGNTKVPFSETDPAELPASLYAATKRADELLSSSYAHLYGFPQIGLRFFTVYGPWGRPDMAYWKFTDKIASGKPIDIYNYGQMLRDFTYIDDVVEGIISISEKAPTFNKRERRAKIYNIGNNDPTSLLDMIGIIERSLSVKAKRNLLPMQPGDVTRTFADISRIQKDYGFTPKTTLENGLSEFIKWYKNSWLGQEAARA